MVSSSVSDFNQEENDLLHDYGMENKEERLTVDRDFVCFCGYMNIIYSASKKFLCAKSHWSTAEAVSGWIISRSMIQQLHLLSIVQILASNM